jgi:hypothetical protein
VVAFEHAPASLIAKAKRMGTSAVAIRTANPLDRDIMAAERSRLVASAWLGHARD